MQNQQQKNTHQSDDSDHSHQSSKEMIYDLETGQIDVDNLPAELIQVFKQAGIKKKDLKNPEYAEAIFEAIVLYNKKKAQIIIKEKPPQKAETEQRELIFDHEKGQIDIEKLPADLIQVFKKAGIRKKDLLQKEFAEMIFQAIESYLLEGKKKNDANQQEQQLVEQYGQEDINNLPPGLDNMIDKRSQNKSKSQIVKVKMNHDEKQKLSEILKGVSRTIYHGEGQWSD